MNDDSVRRVLEQPRARLANVERLLAEAMQPFGPNPTDAIREALAEVRSMLDGDTE